MNSWNINNNGDFIEVLGTEGVISKNRLEYLIEQTLEGRTCPSFLVYTKLSNNKRIMTSAYFSVFSVRLIFLSGTIKTISRPKVQSPRDLRSCFNPSFVRMSAKGIKDIIKENSSVLENVGIATGERDWA